MTVGGQILMAANILLRTRIQLVNGQPRTNSPTSAGCHARAHRPTEAGHTTVSCREPGCSSVWFEPRISRRPTAAVLFSARVIPVTQHDVGPESGLYAMMQHLMTVAAQGRLPESTQTAAS